MMNMLNRSSQVFKKLLFFNGSVLFSMTLQRLVLFLVVVFLAVLVGFEVGVGVVVVVVVEVGVGVSVLYC